jgi:rhomboid protease GluP
MIIYTVAGIVGFTASSFMGAFLPFLPRVLRGAGFTIGASASIFGLIGALAWYGRRTGHSQVSDYAKKMAIGGALFGFLMPGIDNWAHLGGFAGGYLSARILDPLLPERGDHVLLGLLCLLLSAVSVGVSIVTGLSLLRH